MKPPALNLAFLARALLAVAVALGLLTGLHWYIGARMIADAQLAAPWAALGWAALWAAYGSLFLAFLGGRMFPKPLAKLAQWVGFSWLGAFALLVPGLFLTDLLLGGASLVTTVDPAWLPLRALALAGLVVPALACGGVVARRPRVKLVEVLVPGLHPDFDGFRIVQLSDVHIGETLGRDFAAQVTAQVNALEPDLVAVTGDLIDGSVTRLRDEVAPLGRLAGRYGVFYVTGNHEYYSGAAPWEAEVGRLGFTVLHNEHRLIQAGEAKLVVVGVTDVEGARFSEADAPDLTRALQGAPPGVPRLLLAHQPRFAKQAQGHGISLMLSGHTHGGQIYPFNFFVRLQQPVVGGLHTLFGVLTYTSLGTGYWGPPVRIGPRGEITEVLLRAG